MADERWTEQRVLRLLRERHAAKQRGNGPEWAYVEHVRSAAGFASKRTIDAMALGLWPSRGHELHGFEVKVSRPDLQRELADPSKADEFYRWCDRFWLVCAPGVAVEADVPSAWGLLVVNTAGDKLRQVRPAPLNPEREDVSRSRLVCLMRAAGAGLAATPDAEAIAAAEERGRERGHAQGVKTGGDWQRLYEQVQPQVEEAREWMNAVRDALGVPLQVWNQEPAQRRREVADALRTVLGQDEAVERAADRIEQAAQTLEQEAARLRASAPRRARART